MRWRPVAVSHTAASTVGCTSRWLQIWDLGIFFCESIMPQCYLLTIYFFVFGAFGCLRVLPSSTLDLECTLPYASACSRSSISACEWSAQCPLRQYLSDSHQLSMPIALERVRKHQKPRASHWSLIVTFCRGGRPLGIQAPEIPQRDFLEEPLF